MKKLIAIGGVGLLSLLQPQTASARQVGLLERLMPASRNMSQQELLRGRVGTQAMDPLSLYAGVIQALQNYNHDEAETLCEKIISYGPANNPKFKEAAYQIQTGIWKDILAKYPTIMRAERATADHLLDRAEQLESNDPLRTEYINKAKAYMQSIQRHESNYKRALKKLGVNK